MYTCKISSVWALEFVCSLRFFHSYCLSRPSALTRCRMSSAVLREGEWCHWINSWVFINRMFSANSLYPLLISEFLGQISSWALHHLTYQTLAHSLSYDFCFFTKKVRHLLFFLPLFFWFSYILASSSLTEPQNPSQSSACEGSRGHSVIFLVSRRVINTSFSWKSVVCLERSLCIFWRHIILNFNSSVFTSCVHTQLFMNPHIKHVFACPCTHAYCCHCEKRVQSECSFSEQAHQPVKSTHLIETKTRKISFIINGISFIVFFVLF